MTDWSARISKRMRKEARELRERADQLDASATKIEKNADAFKALIATRKQKPRR